MALTVLPAHEGFAEIVEDAGALVELPWEEIPQLITDLRRAYNTWKSSLPQEQAPADGVVSAFLLQSHIAASPGDFS